MIPRFEVSWPELDALLELERAARRVHGDSSVPSVDSTCELEAKLNLLDRARALGRLQ